MRNPLAKTRENEQSKHKRHMNKRKKDTNIHINRCRPSPINKLAKERQENKQGREREHTFVSLEDRRICSFPKEMERGSAYISITSFSHINKNIFVNIVY